MSQDENPQVPINADEHEEFVISVLSKEVGLFRGHFCFLLQF